MCVQVGDGLALDLASGATCSVIEPSILTATTVVPITGIVFQWRA
jgi:hypothetical protein